MRARTSVAARRREVRAAVATRTNLVGIAVLTALAAVQRIVLKVRLRDARTVALEAALRAVADSDARAIDAEVIAAVLAALTTIAIVRVEITTTLATTIRQTRTALAFAIVAVLLALAERTALAAV